MSESYPVWSDSKARHWVWLQRHPADAYGEGGISLSGQRLGGGEYEYSFLVRPAGLSSLWAAFGVSDAAPLDELAAVVAARYGEVREVGDRAWLEQHGVPFEFWSRVEE